MAYDGVFAGVVARELSEKLSGAKIEKVQQPEPDEIVLQLNTKTGREKLLISTAPQSAGVWLTSLPYENPVNAPSFCMLLRKHIQGGRIAGVSQVATERITVFDIETVNEMGYSVSRRLIAETMGKHSNLVLTDSESGKIIDSIKRISIDVNRYRQLLPGLVYVGPPDQGKLDFWTASEDDIRQRLAGASGPEDKALMGAVQGLGPTAAFELSAAETGSDPAGNVLALRERILEGDVHPVVYVDAGGKPRDVHIFRMRTMEEACEALEFETTGEALDYFYSHRRESNRVIQRSEDLARTIKALQDKQLLKKQRLLEDLKKAEDADIYRLKGELLNANLHLVKPGARSVEVVSYYDGKPVTIELDERFPAAKNAQNYYKRYAKAKTAGKEKLLQLTECEKEIEYLASVLSMAPLASTNEEIDLLRSELVKQGFIRARKAPQKNAKEKFRPRHYTVEGHDLYVGRSNIENDFITFRMASKTDLWFHTKDIPGAHAVLITGGEEMGEKEIYGAAAIAAWFSKAGGSENVPVDYVPVRYVKKPAGAKPGMVIFTNNRTVWVDPKDPGEETGRN